MYGENTKTIAIPIYRVLPYPVISREISSVEKKNLIVITSWSADIWPLFPYSLCHVKNGLEEGNVNPSFACIMGYKVDVILSRNGLNKMEWTNSLTS